MKRFFKLMVTSATYRQAAVATKEKLEKDRDNRLLSRGPRFRMDAEMIRDYALAASGLLRPQDRRPERQAVPARRRLGSGGDDRQQHARLRARQRREPLSPQHVHVLEAGRPAGVDGNLNAPNRETCAVRRERTNTPLQALVTLNDAQFVEAARVLAETRHEKPARTTRPASTSWPSGCWPGRSGRRKWQS